MSTLDHKSLGLMLLLALILICSTTSAASLNSRIVGGTNAAVGQFPSMVSLQTTAQRHFCGGSIISARWLLTAAHCVWDRQPQAVRVRSGTVRHNQGGQFNLVAQIRVHENFVNVNNRYNDIAAVQIQGQFAVNVQQRPIALDTTAALGLVAAQAIGWGQLGIDQPRYPDNLQTITTSTLTDAECLQQAAIPVMTRVQICTLAGPGRGICTGDSGSPLIVNGRLAGIASSAVPCALGRPDVYTRVAAYAQWIAATTV